MMNTPSGVQKAGRNVCCRRKKSRYLTNALKYSVVDINLQVLNVGAVIPQ